jgi:hypothetical protein
MLSNVILNTGTSVSEYMCVAGGSAPVAVLALVAAGGAGATAVGGGVETAAGSEAVVAGLLVSVAAIIAYESRKEEMRTKKNLLNCYDIP